MNWQRIALLMKFDLRCSLLGIRAWLFLLPFFICWYLVFKQINKGVTEILQSQEGIMITSSIYGTDGALNLFINHPPSLSLFYLITLSTIPFFTVLASYDQFSTDLGSGFLRFLIPRCRRLEIFLSRFLSAFILVAVAFLIVTLVCTVLSIRNDGYPASDVMLYAFQVYLTLLLYALAFIAYMSVISSMVSSSIASLFLGYLGYALTWFLNLFTFFTGRDDLFSYVLASGIKHSLIELDTGDFFIALSLLPVYVLAYTATAYWIFRRRNL